MKQIILISLSLLVFACTNPSEKKSEKQTEKVEKINKSTPLDTVFAKFDHVFKYDKDGMKEILGYNQLSDTVVDFFIQLENENQIQELTGQAVCLYCSMDSEMDEDENGLAYPASEYFYESENYVVSIRIDIESGENAKLNFAENEALELFAMRLLKRISK